MKVKDMETKNLVGLAAIIFAVAAAITAAAVLIAKCCKRKKTEKYYIDCSDEAVAVSADQENDSDTAEETENT